MLRNLTNQKIMTTKKTYKWGNYEIELGKVYTYKDFATLNTSQIPQPETNLEE